MRTNWFLNQLDTMSSSPWRQFPLWCERGLHWEIPALWPPRQTAIRAIARKGAFSNSGSSMVRQTIVSVRSKYNDKSVEARKQYVEFGFYWKAVNSYFSLITFSYSWLTWWLNQYLPICNALNRGEELGGSGRVFDFLGTRKRYNRETEIFTENPIMKPLNKIIPSNSH